MIKMRTMKIENFMLENYKDVLSLWKKTEITITSSDSEKEVERMWRQNPDLFLIGKVDEHVIGVVMGGFDGRRGYVHHLAVDPNYQKKGYGKKLMNELMARFDQKRVHKVHLFIEKRNNEVINFYRKLGWEIRDDLIMMSCIPVKT
jgi:ribosomal protein S18 acetylase RimI-like enzyme